jgi:tRNA(Phe) wybutosine-synthesizing methylase Tyw3
MGLYPVEKVVLERYDGGQSVDQITRATGFRRATVQNIIQRFDVNLAQDERRADQLRAQTHRLGELVRQAGGHR